MLKKMVHDNALDLTIWKWVWTDSVILASQYLIKVVININHRLCIVMLLFLSDLSS